jgi:hypothetical protein
MKKYLIIITAVLSFTACQNQDEKKTEVSSAAKDSSNYTTIQWVDSVKDIGVIDPGQKAEIKFRFKNSGSKPLFIISAQPGCGCTVADYPKEAIAPGAEGTITAAYNVTKGTTGEFRKNIQVTTNTKGSTSHYIYFKGSIKNEEDSTPTKKADTVALNAIKEKELKRNVLLKSTTKN